MIWAKDFFIDSIRLPWFSACNIKSLKQLDFPGRQSNCIFFCILGAFTVVFTQQILPGYNQRKTYCVLPGSVIPPLSLLGVICKSKPCLVSELSRMERRGWPQLRLLSLLHHHNLTSAFLCFSVAAGEGTLLSERKQKSDADLDSGLFLCSDTEKQSGWKLEEKMQQSLDSFSCMLNSRANTRGEGGGE